MKDFWRETWEVSDLNKKAPGQAAGAIRHHHFANNQIGKA
jgi:hypothetical protein